MLQRSPRVTTKVGFFVRCIERKYTVRTRQRELASPPLQQMSRWKTNQDRN